MKRTLLFMMMTGFAIWVNAQCTPDLLIAENEPPGVYPTPMQGIDPGAFQMPYSQDFTLVTLTDTSINSVTYTVDSVVVELGSAPAGLTIQCDQPDCTYAPGDSGCFVISGTPTEEATSITVVVNIHSTFPLSPFPLPYQYNVNMVGIEEHLDPNKFGLSHNEPNPFSGETKVVFNSPRSGEQIEFKVYDMLGKMVHRQKVESERGINRINFNKVIPAGSYIYSISNGAETFTKKMMVK